MSHRPSCRPQGALSRCFAPATSAALVIAGLALPFAKTGTLVRNGFSLSAALRSSGLAGGGTARLAAIGVDIVPVLVALAVILGGAGTRWPAATRAAALLAATIGALGLLGGLAVLTEPYLQPAPGAPLSVAAGTLTLCVAARSALRPRRREPRPDPIGDRSKGAPHDG